MTESLCTSSLPSCNSPLPGSLSQIDALLVHLSHTSRRLLTARNSLVPVSRLPPEVLSTVFLNLHPIPSNLFAAPSSKDLRAASQTCTAWRAAALSCAILWVQPETHGVHASWTAEMLYRSQRAALAFHAQIGAYEKGPALGRLHFGDPSTPQIDACRLVLEHADRIVEMHLQGDVLSLDQLPGTVLPRLRSLIVCNLGRLSVPDTVRPGATFSWGDAPALEELELRNCALDWNAQGWKNCSALRSLIVEGTSGMKPTVESILGVLRGMTQLRTLILDAWLVQVSGEVKAGTVVLDDLEELLLSGTPIGVATLLEHLALPARARVDLHCTFDDAVELPRLHTAISALHHTAAPRQRPVQSAHIIVNEMQLDICLSGANAVRDMSLEKAHREGSTCLTLSFDWMNSPAFPAFVLDVVRAVPLHGVESLLLDDYDTIMDFEARRQLLALLPRVRTISTRQNASPTLLAFFSDVWDLGAGQPGRDDDEDDFSHWFNDADLPV